MDETPLSPSARRALEVFEAQTTVPLAPARRDALWRAAVSSAQPARNQWVLKAIVLSVSFAVGAGVVTRLLGARPREVQASPTAQWSRTADAVTVQRGQLRLQPRVKLAVATPHLQAVVQNAAALFDVSAEGTVLAVESGEVAWRAPGKSGVLRAGEQVRVKPAAPTLTIAPGVPAVDGCVPGAELEQCLAREAEGSGLAAETALYALAMVAHERGELATAVRLFRAYGERFPRGVFAPEASIALMVDLRQTGELEAARAEAARFSSRFADEPRVEEVAAWGEQRP